MFAEPGNRISEQRVGGACEIWKAPGVVVQFEHQAYGEQARAFDAAERLIQTNPCAGGHVMSVGQRQAVAIRRAVHSDARLIIVGERTAVPGVEKTGRVLSIIERPSDLGQTIPVTRHNLDTSSAVPATSRSRTAARSPRSS
jgi:ABC-type sugar transport system ATPase subunit